MRSLLCLLTIFILFSLTGCGDGTSRSNQPKSILSEKTDIPLAGQPYEAVCADFNGDGLNDLAVTVKYSGVFVFFNNGKNFDEYKKFTGLFHHGISIKTGDMNGDGNHDLVVLVEDAIQFFTGDGKGNFVTSEKYYPGPIMSTYVDLTELNNDSLPDMVAVGQNDSRVFIYINEGNLNFSVTTIMLESADAFFSPEFRQVSTADLDGDGYKDILLADSLNGIIWVLWNNADGTFIPAVVYTTSDYVGSVASYSKKGNSLPYIVFTEEVQDGSLVFLVNAGGRKFKFSQKISVYPMPAYIRVTDMDSNGIDDIILNHLTSDKPLQGRISVLYGPDFAKTYDTTISGISFYSAVCDWNRDGRPDIFAPNISADSVTYIPSDIIAQLQR
jgi:hypothetical protein